MHPHEKITPYDTAATFRNTYVKVTNIEKGVSVFTTAGIYPLHPEKSKKDFAARSDVEQGLSILEDTDAVDVESEKQA